MYYGVRILYVLQLSYKFISKHEWSDLLQQIRDEVGRESERLGDFLVVFFFILPDDKRAASLSNIQSARPEKGLPVTAAVCLAASYRGGLIVDCRLGRIDE